MPNQPPVIIVSGGSRGLGRGIILKLLEAGYFVETFSRTKNKDIEALEQGPNAACFHWHQVDAASLEALENFYNDIINKHASIHALINNVGIAVDGVLSLMPTESITNTININLRSTIYLTKMMSKIMLRNRGGIIINISSIIGIRGYAGLSTYSATKSGLDGFSRALARELGPRGIRVNSIAPGYIATEMSQGLSKTQKQQIIRRTPLGRLAKIDDVINLIIFLLSKQAEFITGQTLVVDGGITC